MITPGPLRCPPADETLTDLNQPKPRPRLNNKLRREHRQQSDDPWSAIPVRLRRAARLELLGATARDS
jgi:hypothetical protein